MPINSPGTHQPSRQRHIVVAGHRIAGRMIVKQHDRRRAGPSSPRETLHADGRCWCRAFRPTAASIAARDASCRAARRRTARPARLPNCGNSSSAASRELRNLRPLAAAANQRAAARFDGGDQLRGPRARRCPGPGAGRRVTIVQDREGRQPTRAPRSRDRAHRSAARPVRARSPAARCRRARRARRARAFHAVDRAAQPTSSYTIPAILPAQCVACR